MLTEKEEIEHITQVLTDTKKALLEKDSNKLRELSDNTIHAACRHQDSASITIAVVVYSLSKLVERHDYSKVKNWEKFVQKLNGIFELAIKALEGDKHDLYQTYIQKARLLLSSNDITIKPYIEGVIKKASINKGSKIYERGISIEQASKLLGVSQWELSEYIGQKQSFQEVKQLQSIEIKKRAKTAMEFFS